MASLIWHIEPRASLPDHIARAADTFQLRLGIPATHLVTHHADHERIMAVPNVAQQMTASSAPTGTVSVGMFWLGTPG